MRSGLRVGEGIHENVRLDERGIWRVLTMRTPPRPHGYIAHLRKLEHERGTTVLYRHRHTHKKRYFAYVTTIYLGKTDEGELLFKDIYTARPCYKTSEDSRVTTRPSYKTCSRGTMDFTKIVRRW